jgi:hypothetical protein
LRQYERVAFSDPTSDWFKAALYIYQANHGQFNTSWGRYDLGLPRAFLLNTQPLMDGEAQREIAKLYISAFLDATLKGERAYLPMFQDFRNAGDWLPPTLYINQFHDATFQPLLTYEEDVDVTTTTVPGGTITGSSLSGWKELNLIFRTGRSQENQAVQLGWDDQQGSYQITLPPELAGDWGLTGDSILIFSAANGSGDSEEVLDFSIILEDANGVQVSLNLSNFGDLLPQFPVQFTQLPTWEDERYENATEPIMQTFRLPLSIFTLVDPAFDPAQLTAITFRFNASEDGRIYLDNLGFAR